MPDTTTRSNFNGSEDVSADAGLLEEAEAEAAEAEALAAAARARLKAMRLAQRGQLAKSALPEASAVAPGGDDTPSEEDPPSKDETPLPLVDATVTDASASRSDVDEPPPEREARRPRRPATMTVLVSIALLGTAGLIAASAVMIRHHAVLTRQQHRAAEFTAAARQIVVTLMSIDAARAKDDVQRIIDSSTGQFKSDFQTAADDFVKAAQKAKAATKTSVRAAAVDSMTSDTAVVLVAANTTLTDTTGAAGQPRSWRLSLKLVRDGGQIKMSSMEFIP